jgi:hypothetical protein
MPGDLERRRNECCKSRRKPAIAHTRCRSLRNGERKGSLSHDPNQRREEAIQVDCPSYRHPTYSY